MTPAEWRDVCSTCSHDIRIMESDTIVSIVDVSAARLDEPYIHSRWQDHAHEIAFGLFAGKQLAHKAVPAKLKEIIGHAPTINATYQWIRQIQQKYRPKPF